MAAQRLSRRHKRILQWLAADHQRTRGMIRSSHQDLVRALPGDKGNIRPRAVLTRMYGIHRPPSGYH